MMSILPGIHEQEEAELKRKLQLVSGLIEAVHITISDGTMIPAITAPLPDISRLMPDVFLEICLLSLKPETLIDLAIRAGCKRIIAPVEAHAPREYLEEARSHDCEIGLSMDIETPIEEIEPLLEEIDSVLVFTAPMGLPQQPFEDQALKAIKTIHRNFPDLPIEVKGGIDRESVQSVGEAGATRIVSQSYLFRDPSRISEALQSLRDAVA